MPNLFYIGSWLLLSAVILAPPLYLAIAQPTAAFWENVMSGLLATASALVGGIPLALWIDRHIKAKDAAAAAKEERARELELLDLIKEELQFSFAGLARRQVNTEAIDIQPLKSDLWVAIAAAGKLNHIRNHRLLNRITSAYYVVNVVRDIERQAYIALRSATVTFSTGQTAMQQVWSDARRFDNLLGKSIQEAIREIDEEIKRKNQVSDKIVEPS